MSAQLSNTTYPALGLFSSWWDRSMFLLLVLVLGWVIYAAGSRFVGHLFRERGWDLNLIEPMKQVAWPLLMLLPVLLALPLFELDPRLHDWFRHGLALACIWLLTVFAFRGVGLFRCLVLFRHDTSSPDNLSARKAQTQIVMLESIFKFLILLSGVAMALMTFDRIRQVGLSMLASAGIAGVVLGFAAQKFIATLIAGVQIALTQPIRIDDAVIVEGEFGWIEEITLTYVVVRLWDLRRLVVPTPNFIDKPFQNWTRNSGKLMGTVMLHTDYCVPLDSLREELTRLAAASELWNGETCALHVNDAMAEVLQLRVLVSADDAGKLWDLRAEMREGLIRWLQQHHPQALPRTRIDVLRQPDSVDAAALPSGQADEVSQTLSRQGAGDP